MTIGALLRLSDATPRIRMTGAEPVMFGGSMMTPGDLPVSRSAMVLTGEFWTALAASIVDTALPNSTWRWAPVAVVTISWSWMTIGAIEKSTVIEPFAVTAIGFFCSV